MDEHWNLLNVGWYRRTGDGVVLEVNDVELSILGYSREEMIGHHVSEFMAAGQAMALISATSNSADTRFSSEPCELIFDDRLCKAPLGSLGASLLEDALANVLIKDRLLSPK